MRATIPPENWYVLRTKMQAADQLELSEIRRAHDKASGTSTNGGMIEKPNLLATARSCVDGNRKCWDLFPVGWRSDER